MHYYINVLKKYAVFKGRATRAEYWYFVLFNVIASIILGIISKIISDQKNILGNIYGLAVIIPSIAVSVRRFHDIGKTGWWVLYFSLMCLAIGILAIILVLPTLIFGVFGISFYIILLAFLTVTVWSIVWKCKDSQPGDNKYGPNPKMISTPTVEPVSPASTPAQ